MRLSRTLAVLFIDSSTPAAYVWGAAGRSVPNLPCPTLSSNRHSLGHEIATIAQMYLHPSILPHHLRHPRFLLGRANNPNAIMPARPNINLGR
jgi:hypothetical protein